MEWDGDVPGKASGPQEKWEADLQRGIHRALSMERPATVYIHQAQQMAYGIGYARKAAGPGEKAEYVKFKIDPNRRLGDVI